MVTGQVSKLVGASVKRKEEPRFLVGEGKYTGGVQRRQMSYLAVLDALAHLGMTEIYIPIRPEKVWRILRDSGITT